MDDSLARALDEAVDTVGSDRATEGIQALARGTTDMPSLVRDLANGDDQVERTLHDAANSAIRRGTEALQRAGIEVNDFGDWLADKPDQAAHAYSSLLGADDVKPLLDLARTYKKERAGF